jgi:hypothetical protein
MTLKTAGVVYDMKPGMRITHYKTEMILKGNREWNGAKRKVTSGKAKLFKVAGRFSCGLSPGEHNAMGPK